MRATAKEIEALTPVGFWGRLRRILGIFTRDEREVLRYARRIRGVAISIRQGKTILGVRPDWMRHEDFKSLQRLQKNIYRQKR